MRTIPLLVAVLSVGASPLMAQTASPASGHPGTGILVQRDGPECDTLDFTDYPSGTVITDQFADCGVLFEEAETYVYDPTYPYGSILHSTTWFNALTLRFVDPMDPSVPRPVGYVAFYNAVDPAVSIGEVDLISVKAYDVDGELIGWMGNASASWAEVDLGASIIASVVVDDSLGTSFVLDNIVVRRESPTAGVADHASAQGMQVFPDPFQDEVHVRTGVRIARPWVTGIDGRTVPTAPPTTEDGGWRLDLHTLPPGVYLVHAGGLQRPLTQRIIKR